MELHPMRIPDTAPPRAFPDVDAALIEPNGLLALGGDLSVPRLLYAYAHGIFPWYSDDQPILWWSPDPRMVLEPDGLKISRSLRKRIRKAEYQVTSNRCFEQVVQACAAPRGALNGTWILPEMLEAYVELHELGHAHSIECWFDGELVGGLYGVAIGQVFFGESMFSKRVDASKVALEHLCRSGYQLIDCQLPSDHLTSLGASPIPRKQFCARLVALCQLPSPKSSHEPRSDSNALGVTALPGGRTQSLS
jgi:leucyl/phenylalanyl-tRNA--protein transferase